MALGRNIIYIYQKLPELLNSLLTLSFRVPTFVA